MVGFKLIALLFSLLLFAACVPQTKQTECKSNEAFNAALRTCVPVVNGPSSFINIDSVLPSAPLVKYKNDATIMSFSVVISNPYAQAYTVVWERYFNGVPTTITPDSPTSYSFAPLLIGSQLGTHIISVKVKDSTNAIVSSHNFQITINDSPRPIIQSVSVTPPLYNSSMTPSSPVQSFQFTVDNNGVNIAGAGYRTDWYLYKGGVLQAGFPETDAFPTTTPLGSESSNGFNFPRYSFNPAVLGAGSYLIRAQLTNAAAEVVSEQQWSVVVAHPPLSKVTARDIYLGAPAPVFTTPTTAYHAIPYTSSPTFNFIPAGETTQGQYCVTVADADGSYAGDNQFVKVDFYLNGSALIHTGYTSIGTNYVCLSQSVNLASVVFTNTTNTNTQAHTLQARVTDMRTSTEYTLSDMNPSLGSYPISWDFIVKPANLAPTVAFTADSNLTNITCGAASASARTCAVTQDQTFVVGVDVADDFYSTITNANKFTYTMNLLKNGISIASCNKTVANVATDVLGADYIGPTYRCAFNVPSFDASGSVNPASIPLITYAVSIVVSDVGSEIAGAPATSAAPLVYNLNVAETNTAPVIDPQGATTSDSYLANSATPGIVLSNASNDSGAANTFITEGETLNLNVLVSDNERDDHQILVYRCQDGVACTTSSVVASLPVNKTNSVLTTQSILTYTIPEDFVPVGTPIGTNVDAYFKIVVYDIPDTVGLGITSMTNSTAPIHFNVNVRNKNPAPQIGGTPVPVKTALIKTMVGYPLSIDPGTVTDASPVASENAIAYQWYIDTTGGDNSYTAITGATSRILKWTPTNAIPSGTIINLAMCVTDGTAVNPLPALGVIGTNINLAQAANGSNCIGSWDVTVQQNAVATAFDNGSVDTGTDMAVWQDTTVVGKRVVYSAYNDVAGYIYIEKTVFDADGKIYNTAVNGFKTVRFAALDGGLTVDPTTIKDISLSGTDEHLYIAYQAAYSGTPNVPRIRVRRIDKRSGVATGSKTDPTYHDAAKFGFRYAQTLPTTTSPSVTVGASTPGQAYTITFGGIISTLEQVTVNGVAFIPVNGAGPICAGGGAFGCTDTGNAVLLANAINNSTDRNLQGVSAVAAADTVTIYGDVGGESADNNVGISGYVPGKLGKITAYLTGGSTWEWHLPFIDLNSAPTIQNIRVLSAGAETADYLSNVTITSSVVYTALGATTWFTNEISGSNMVIGSIDFNSKARLTVFPLYSAVPTTTQTLFNNVAVASGSLRIAAPVSGNPYYYSAAKVSTGAAYEWQIGRYDSSLVIGVESTFPLLSYNAATTTALAVSAIADVELQAVPSSGTSIEARLLVSSNNGTGNIIGLSGDYDLFAVRFRSDNLLSCDACVPLTYGSQELSPSKRIASTKIDRAMEIGSTQVLPAAAVPVSKDVLFAAYGQTVTNGPIFYPQMGIFNMEVEALSTTSTGSLGTEGFRTPFIGN